MKCDPTAVTVAATALIPLAAGLYCVRLKAIRNFAVFLGMFALLELTLMWSGSEESLWWLMHMPSAIALGVDEILENHGRFVSTLAHVGDLVFWSTLAAMLMAVKRRKSERISGSTNPTYSKPAVRSHQE